MIGMGVFALIAMGIVASTRMTQNLALKNFYAIEAVNYASVFFAQIQAMPYVVLENYVNASTIPFYGVGVNVDDITNVNLRQFTNPGLNTPFKLTVNQATRRQLRMNLIPIVDRTQRTPYDSPFGYEYLRSTLTYVYDDPVGGSTRTGITFMHTDVKLGTYTN